MFESLSHLLVIINSVVNYRKEPAGSLKSKDDNNLPDNLNVISATNLEGVGTARLQVEGTQAPVLQLPEKVTRTDALCEMEFTFSIEAQDVLENPR